MRGEWSDSEVRELFDQVEKCKNIGKKLKEAFKIHAEKFARKPDSVRNYYYKEVLNLNKDEGRVKKLNIDVEKHLVNSIKVFSTEEKKSITESIDKLVAKGYSVRRACQELSNGNLSLMLRYQNKYNSLKKEQRPNNVITFKKNRTTITDNELNSLFLGLARLVKKSALEEAVESVRLEKNTLNFMLKKTIDELKKKDNLLEKIKNECENLKIENNRLKIDISKRKVLMPMQKSRLLSLKT